MVKRRLGRCWCCNMLQWPRCLAQALPHCIAWFPQLGSQGDASGVLAGRHDPRTVKTASEGIVTKQRKIFPLTQGFDSEQKQAPEPVLSIFHIQIISVF